MNIFFDLDDTLFPSSEFSTLARKNAINAMIAMGLEKTYEDLNSELTDLISKKGSNYSRHFDDLCKNLKIKNPQRFIAAAIAAYHDTKTAIQPFPTVPPTLLKLKKMGFSLYVLTHGNSIKQWDKLIRLKLALYFDDVFVTDEFGNEKNNDFYLGVLNRLKVSPKDCIMVGDREDSDILTTKALGLKTIRILSGKYSSSNSSADFIISDFSKIPELAIKLKKH